MIRYLGDSILITYWFMISTENSKNPNFSHRWSIDIKRSPFKVLVMFSETAYRTLEFDRSSVCWVISFVLSVVFTFFLSRSFCLNICKDHIAAALSIASIYSSLQFAYFFCFFPLYSFQQITTRNLFNKKTGRRRSTFYRQFGKLLIDVLLCRGRRNTIEATVCKSLRLYLLFPRNM